MASRFNTEFNYRTQVIGETPWEKIKTLKGFLEGRKRAEVLEEVGNIKMKAKEAKLIYLQEHGPLHEALELEAEIIEYKSSAEDAKEAYALNKKELVCLRALLEELYEIAEPTRLPGYSDDDMFEANAENEFATWVVREIQAEIIANGRPSATKLRNAMSSALAVDGLKLLQVLPQDFEVITGHNNIGLLASSSTFLPLTYKASNEAVQDKSN